MFCAPLFIVICHATQKAVGVGTIEGGVGVGVETWVFVGVGVGVPQLA